MTFEELREMLLYRKIVEWTPETITLDNGVKVSIEMTDNDCCAVASGEFSDVVLDAAITDVTDISYHPWDDGDTYGCSAKVTILHNQNIICKVNADADAGNGGYYYSVASFIVRIPKTAPMVCEFVSSERGNPYD